MRGDVTRNILETSVSGFWMLPGLADGIQENVDFHPLLLQQLYYKLQVLILTNGTHVKSCLGINHSSMNLALMRHTALHGLIHLAVSSYFSFGAKIRLNLST